MEEGRLIRLKLSKNYQNNKYISSSYKGKSWKNRKERNSSYKKRGDKIKNFIDKFNK
jgi:hypothetical protein